MWPFNTGWAAEPISSAAATLKEADIAYQGRADLDVARMALVLYQKASVEDPALIEAYWKITRVTWWLAEFAATPQAKAAFYEEGITAAKKAVSLDPRCYQAHFWLGVNYGSLGEAKGVLKSLFLVRPIRREMEEVNKLKPSYEDGGASRTLGIVDYKVPRFAGGSKKRALEELTAALNMGPNDPFNLYYLLEYYVTVGDKEKAKGEMAALQSLTPPPDLVPELKLLQEKAQAFAPRLK